MGRGRGIRAGLTREDVATAAHEVLALEGFAAVTMRRVADALGVAPNTLYSHVEDRGDLGDAVLDLELSRIAMPEAGTTENRIELVMRALWNCLVARPGLAVHLLERTNRSAELARLRRELGELLRRASSAPDLALDYVGVLFSYTIGSAAMAGSTNIVSADRIFRTGLRLCIAGLELEGARGTEPLFEDTMPRRAGELAG